MTTLFFLFFPDQAYDVVDDHLQVDGNRPVIQWGHQGAGGEEPGDQGCPSAVGPAQGGDPEQEQVQEDHPEGDTQARKGACDTNSCERLTPSVGPWEDIGGPGGHLGGHLGATCGG